MANVTDLDRQTATELIKRIMSPVDYHQGFCEGDIEDAATVIAQAREAGEQSGRVQGIEEAASVVYNMHHSMIPVMEESFVKQVADKVRALLPPTPAQDSANTANTKAFMQSCRDMGRELKGMGITGEGE